MKKKDKNCLILVIIQLSQNMMIQKKLLFVRLKMKLLIKAKDVLFLVGESSELKKAKSMNKNVVVAMRHNEYKNNFLNNKCLRHSKN